MENEETIEFNTAEKAKHNQDEHTMPGDVLENAAEERTITRGMCIGLGLEIGRVTIPLSEWSEVSKGSILMLEGVKVGHAYLTDAEGVIAYGDLLDVEGTIGFQIKRWRTA